MKTQLLSLAALIASSLVSQAQVVVQQQTTTYTNNPGVQLQFNAWNPLQNAPQYYSVWDAITNQYILVPVSQQQQIVYTDQYGNPIQSQVTYYTDQYGNPVQQQTTTSTNYYPQPNQPIVYIDQYGNPIQQQQQQIIYNDPYSTPVRPSVIPAHPIQANTCAPVNTAYPMAQADFSNALMQIHNQDFESTRLTVAKQMLAGNWVTSDQVRQMMLQMNFEDSRIELARFAYNRVVDPQNYYLVNNGFTFSSSVDQLNQYLFGR
jgi:hypothetical protein